MDIRQYLPAHFPELATIWGAKIAVSLLIFLAFFGLSLVLKRIIRRWSPRTDPQREAVVQLLGSILRTALIIFGLVTATGTLGIDISALVAGLGLTGFALGFAFRDALSNVLAGIMILFYRPFRRGERITVLGLEGQVANIDLRYTTLVNGSKTFLIPNSVLLTNAITVNRE